MIVRINFELGSKPLETLISTLDEFFSHVQTANRALCVAKGVTLDDRPKNIEGRSRKGPRKLGKAGNAREFSAGGTFGFRPAKAVKYHRSAEAQGGKEQDQS